MVQPDVRRFLESHRVGHLGTADADGRPHVVPVCYALGPQRIYSMIDDKPKSVPRNKLRRIRNIRSNPNVCLTVDTYSDNWARLGFVMVHGTASIVYSGPEHEAAADLLRQRYAQYRDMGTRDRPIVVIEPRRIVRWGNLRPSAEKTPRALDR